MAKRPCANLVGAVAAALRSPDGVSAMREYLKHHTDNPDPMVELYEHEGDDTYVDIDTDAGAFRLEINGPF